MGIALPQRPETAVAHIAVYKLGAIAVPLVGLILIILTFNVTRKINFVEYDNENHACSYGTNRRPPSDRSHRLPPQNAHCSNRAESSSPSSQPGAGQESGTEVAPNSMSAVGSASGLASTFK